VYEDRPIAVPRVPSVARLRRARVTRTVVDLQTAFHAEMRRYLVGGGTHFAMSTAPSVPAELADVVLGVHNTHDVHPRPMIHHAPILPAYGDGHGDGLGPPDWATVYDVAPLYASGVNGTPIDGTGVTIAIVGVAEISQSDIAAFRTQFGLPVPRVFAGEERRHEPRLEQREREGVARPDLRAARPDRDG
jgi:subtilase family serine protease